MNVDVLSLETHVVNQSCVQVSIHLSCHLLLVNILNKEIEMIVYHTENSRNVLVDFN